MSPPFFTSHRTTRTNSSGNFFAQQKKEQPFFAPVSTLLNTSEQETVQEESEKTAQGKFDTSQMRHEQELPLPGYRSPALQMRSALRSMPGGSVIQRASVHTWAGTWKTEKYRGVNSSAETGVDIVLAFHPNRRVDATSIGLTQGLTSMDEGILNPINTTAAGRSIPAGEADAGFYIDRLHSKSNPIYGSNNLAAGADLNTTPANNNTSGKRTRVGHNKTSYQLGYRHGKGGRAKIKKASLFDAPRRSPNRKNACQIFETTALALDGTQKGDFYGSVQWGWQTDGAAKFKRLPLKVISEGVPSAKFIRAAELWNATTTSDGTATTDLPMRGNIVVTNVPETDFLDSVGGKRISRLTQGTRLEDTGNRNAPYSEVRVVDGRGNRRIMYRTGWVITAHLNDERV